MRTHCDLNTTPWTARASAHANGSYPKHYINHIIVNEGKTETETGKLSEFMMVVFCAAQVASAVPIVIFMTFHTSTVASGMRLAVSVCVQACQLPAGARCRCYSVSCFMGRELMHCCLYPCACAIAGVTIPASAGGHLQS